MERRIEYYRSMARDAQRDADKAITSDLRKQYLKVVAAWTSLADNTEAGLVRSQSQDRK